MLWPERLKHPGKRRLAIAVHFGLAVFIATRPITSSATEPLAGDRAEVASELSDPYRLGSKQVESTPHPDRFDALTNSSDPQVAGLAKLLVTRETQRAIMAEKTAILREKFKEQVGQMQSALGRYFAGEVFGPERSNSEKMKDIAGKTKKPVTGHVQLQKDVLNMAIDEVKLDQKVRRRIKGLQGPLTADEGAEKDFFVSFRLDPAQHRFAAVSIKNRGQEALHHVLVLVELDCKYDPDWAKQELDALGAVVLMGMGINDQRLSKSFSDRDKAQATYEDLDKGGYVYLETWNPSATLEMDVQDALSLLKYTRSAKLTIVSDELTVVDQECPLDAGKKKLVADLKAQLARQKKMAAAARKNPQKAPQKSTRKSAAKGR